MRSALDRHLDFGSGVTDACGVVDACWANQCKTSAESIKGNARPGMEKSYIHYLGRQQEWRRRAGVGETERPSQAATLSAINQVLQLVARLLYTLHTLGKSLCGSVSLLRIFPSMNGTWTYSKPLHTVKTCRMHNYHVTYPSERLNNSSYYYEFCCQAPRSKILYRNCSVDEIEGGVRH